MILVRLTETLTEALTAPGPHEPLLNLLPPGTDCAVTAEQALELVTAGQAVVVGGDAADFVAYPDLVPAAG